MKEIWYGLDEYTRMAIGLVVAFLLFSLYCYIGYKIEYKSSDESLRSKTKQPKKKAVRTI